MKETPSSSSVPTNWTHNIDVMFPEWLSSSCNIFRFRVLCIPKLCKYFLLGETDTGLEFHMRLVGIAQLFDG